MLPSTRIPGPKMEVYYCGEGHSHASAAQACMNWRCCTQRMGNIDTLQLLETQFT
jgi:hypothetical protein